MDRQMVVLASGNAGKLRELNRILAPLQMELRSQAEFDVPEVPEDGLSFVENAIIKAHEFHYSSLKNLEDTGEFALKVLRGTGIDGEYDGIVYKNTFACYTHQRNTRSNPWVKNFTDFIRSRPKS